MSELFSAGHNARVYTLSDYERMRFPGAGLARVENRPAVEEDRSFLLRYYGYKIAHLLLPEHFVEVVGARRAAAPGELEGSDTAKHDILYTKLANVPEGHAVYAAHFDKSHGLSPCRCQTCLDHVQLHQEFDLARMAKSVAESAARFGFGLPSGDPTDYCLGENGVIFFEYDLFYPSMLIERLSTMRGEDVAQEALRYVDLYLRAQTS